MAAKREHIGRNPGNHQDIPFHQLLTDDQVQLILQRSNIVHFDKKEIIFRQNTPAAHIMVVKSGRVKIFKENRTRRTLILNLPGSGEFIGLMAAFGSDIFEYSCATLEETHIRFIDISIFRKILAENGKYALKIITTLSNQGLFIFDRLLNQSHKQLPGRIADVLLYFSETVYGSIEFDFPLTRRELAELAGTTKESFIRTLTEFKNDRIIELNGTRVRINSMDIVRTLSDLG